MARYLKRREADIKSLRRALDAAEFEAIRTTGHNLFGSGAAYGLEKISHLGEGIEDAAQARDAERINGLIEDLARYLKNLKVR